ncbi:ninja-family protein AFP3-like [Primulina tabacum]|uniref:ninja-family protein AFP3-like n=1 Tax=Primulina tabacum TaxID=48773 RepID=UPI003F590DDB
MGDGDVITKILTTSDMENLSLDVSASKYSRDLLQRFRGSVSQFEVLEEKGEDIELNLGLSLGGRFGVDKSCKSLVRSSSIAVCSHVVRDDSDNVKSTPITGLVRTSSLPVETEEEWRKRKGLQTLRRMEAKRRRSEKQRILRGDKEAGGIYVGGGVGGGSLSSEAESAVKSFGSISRAARRAICGGGTDVAMAKVASPGSGSSSCVSDSEGKFRQGSSDEPSPTSTRPLKVHNQDVCSSSSKSQENTSKTTGSDISASPSKKSDTSRTGGRKVRTNAIEDMPCVFTVGDGPNGRRVDGILYKYGKGEVRIMCICCGKFHSPSEFVGHAGGTDLDHPLKHIVVNSYASSLL